VSISVVKCSVVKCSEVLQCSNSPSNKVSNIIRRHIDNRKVLLIYRVIHKSLRDFRPLRYSSRVGHAEGEHVNRGRDTPSFCPTLQVLDMLPSEGSWQTFLAHARQSRSMAPAGLTEVFPCFFLSCKANARVQLAKTLNGPHSSKIFVLFYVLFVLCRSVYCLCVNVHCTTATGWQPNCS